MSRFAAFASAERPAEGRAQVVHAMLSAMPRGEDRLLEGARASMGWSGKGGGGAARAAGLNVVVDGEVFNLPDLAAAFDNPPESDAQAIAFLVRRYGIEGALQRMNGDFAILIEDPGDGRIWCARDRVGLKPLYYAENGDGFACASQPAGLLRVPGVAARPNRRFAALIAGSHYRVFDNAPHEAPFESMRQLPAGHYLELAPGGAIRVARYWTLGETAVRGGTEAELAGRYRELLLAAVARRLARSERPAFTLSGGMDSSSVLCCAVEASGRKQHAFSSVYVDPTFDERQEIRDVVEARVSRWHAVELGREIDVLANVRKLAAIHNEPVATATWLSHQEVCTAAATEGFDALFGGLGGDELNAGEYEYFPMHFADLRAQGREVELAHEVARWAAHHDHPIYRKDAQAAESAMAALTVAGTPGEVRPNLERLLRYAHVVRKDYFDLERFVPVMEHPFRSFLANRAFQDLSRETTPCCLRAEDRQATAAGLRHYDPFLDHEVVEFMFSVPGAMKIRDGVTKRLLRESMRGILPEATRTRVKKTGWNAPAHVWFTGRTLAQVRDLVGSRRFRERGIYDAAEVARILDEHERIVASGEARENHMMFIWQLVNLDAWLAWAEAFS